MTQQKLLEGSFSNTVHFEIWLIFKYMDSLFSGQKRCDFSKAAYFQKVRVFRSRLALLYEFNHKILEMNIPLLNKPTTKKKMLGLNEALETTKCML